MVSITKCLCTDGRKGLNSVTHEQCFEHEENRLEEKIEQSINSEQQWQKYTVVKACVITWRCLSANYEGKRRKEWQEFGEPHRGQISEDMCSNLDCLWLIWGGNRVKQGNNLSHNRNIA